MQTNPVLEQNLSKYENVISMDISKSIIVINWNTNYV